MLQRDPLSCKVGTQPALIVPYGRCNIEIGKKIRFRHARDGKYGPIHTGVIDKVNPDGYFFINLM